MAHTSSRYEEVHRAAPVIRVARGVRSCYVSTVRVQRERERERYVSAAISESTGNQYVFLPVPACENESSRKLERDIGMSRTGANLIHLQEIGNRSNGLRNGVSVCCYRVACI